MYKTVVRLALRFDFIKPIPLTNRQKPELNMAEIKDSRFLMEVSRMEKIRNDYARGTGHIG